MGIFDKLFGKESTEQLRPKTTRQFQVYEDAGGKWRWKLISPSNGATVASSGEAFDSEGNALRAAQTEALFYIEGTVSIIKKARKAK